MAFIASGLACLMASMLVLRATSSPAAGHRRAASVLDVEI
jgi:hypothetical protein